MGAYWRGRESHYAAAEAQVKGSKWRNSFYNEQLQPLRKREVAFRRTLEGGGLPVWREMVRSGCPRFEYLSVYSKGNQG